MVADLPLVHITGRVLELHAKSGPSWSRAKILLEDGSTAWVTAKFGITLDEILDAKAIFNEKFRSYDVVSLIDTDGNVSNGVVVLKLVELLDGVGQIKARKLSEQFPNLWEAVTNDPEAIAAACGADLIKIQQVAFELTGQQEQLSRVSTLINQGYPNYIARRAASKEETYRIAKDSPYAAIRVVDGLGWLIADEVGRKMGIKVGDPERIKAGIDHHYRERVAKDGHTRVTQTSLLSPDALPSLLGIPSSKIGEYLDVVLVKVAVDGNTEWFSSGYHKKNAEKIATFFLR